MAGYFEKFFGLNLENNKANTAPSNQIQPDEKSFALPENQDGALVVQTGGHFGAYVDLDGSSVDDIALINKYREMAMTPELDQAITHIVDDAIISEENGKIVTINMDNMEEPDALKKKITAEFENILRMLNFQNNAYEIFRRWYIDGRLFYHVIYDEKKPKDGIKELRYVDPRRIRKVREIRKSKDAKTGADIITFVRDYYMYNERGMIGAYSNLGSKINPDAVAYVHSGLIDARKNQVLSHLHKAIKPLNNLRMVEDATVIYRMSRAPERRVFYIDVGGLPTAKAEQYLKAQMNRFRNKIVYDATTGELRDERKHMSMLEDFWLPRREGNKNTEITTLPAGQNLGQIEDVQYMQDRLYKALNIPFSRISNPTGGFSLGKTTEITRDEIAFSKFIKRLRKRFSSLFVELLRRQLIMKGIVKEDEWDDYQEHIWFEFVSDVVFEEMKRAELLRERVLTLTQIDPFVGRYYSMEWVRKNVLSQTEEEMEEIMKQIDKEKEEGIFTDPNAAMDPNNPANQFQQPDALPPPGQQAMLPAPSKQPVENNTQNDFDRFAPKMTPKNQ